MRHYIPLVPGLGKRILEISCPAFFPGCAGCIVADPHGWTGGAEAWKRHGPGRGVKLRN